jgi:endonuclease/exonuclease/phosphatase family metal-dependent hydrolase
MKKIIAICVAGCIAANLVSCSVAVARGGGRKGNTRVISCNIRVTGLPEDEVAGRRWEDRREVLVEVIRSRKPDIICTQEVIYDSYEYMREQFKEYFAFGFTGPEMDPFTDGYHFIAKNVVFFRRDRYDLRSAGSYWLSDEPLIGGSVSWNTARARHCNWVRLRDRKTGVEFRVLNIHLDHKSDEARREQTKLILEECAQYAADFPQIICGDFNARINGAPIGYMRNAGWKEAYETVHGAGEAGYTGHAFKGTEYDKGSGRIDFIFTHGRIDPVSAEIIKDKIDGVYPSDHFFVISDMVIR